MWSGKIRKTPIGSILFVTFIDSGLSLPSFIGELGYHHLHKGIRTFHSFVKTGMGNSLLLYRLQRSRFALAPEVLLDAVTSTDWQLHAEREDMRARDEHEEASTFRPAVYPVSLLDPDALITRYPVSDDFDSYASFLPSTISVWEAQTQISFVRAVIRENFRANNGSVTFFGPIISYLYWKRWDEPPIAFSKKGDPLGVAPQRNASMRELCTRDTPIQRKLLAESRYSGDMAVFH